MPVYGSFKQWIMSVGGLKFTPELLEVFQLSVGGVPDVQSLLRLAS